MRKREAILLFLLIVSSVSARGQKEVTPVVMGVDAYLRQLYTHHPMARQAQLRIEQANAYLTKAKGNFDPKIAGGIQQKYFKDDQYYSVIHAGLKVPTWYGISLQGGYDLNSGTRLNPERSVPDEGLWHAGLQVTLGKGLIIDQRRAELKKARIYVNSAVQQQRVMLNDLLLNASMAYWEWFNAYNKMNVYRRAVENAQQRLEAVRQSTTLGDKPPIDTLEADIQVQLRMINFSQAQLEYKNTSEMLSIYLWDKGLIPLELDSLTRPPSALETATATVDPQWMLQLDSIAAFHPALLESQYKIEQKKIDVKWSREQLKPSLNLKYNAITRAAGGNLADNYSLNNYTWGADLHFPIFLRKERGQLRLDQLEVEGREAELAFKTEQVNFKIKTAFNTWTTTVEQITLWRETTQKYRVLFESEQTLFETGESSLFMINSREKAYINAQLKLVDTMTKNQQSALKAYYAMGQLQAN